MEFDVAELTRDLVRIPSLNPMGRAVSGPNYLEARMAEMLTALFDILGLPHEQEEVEPGRINIWAQLRGQPGPEAGGRLLVFEAHQDTVPIEGMTIDPFGGTIHDGKVWGRGACDVKGGMAAMIAALAHLKEIPASMRPTVVMACTVNEEFGFSGAKAFARRLTGQPGTLIPRRPDAAIVAEPTGLNVVAAHKGAIRWRILTHGRAAHSSNPNRGDNAIYRMARVIEQLETYSREVLPQLGEHPLLGPPTLSVGTIQGGISINTVPDSCVIELDRRLLPTETATEARQHVLDALAGHLGEQAAGVTHQEPLLVTGGLSDEINRPLAENLLTSARLVSPTAEIVGVPYGTNAPKYEAVGVPTVVFGPGQIEQAHTIDEWIEISQLRSAVEVLVEFACRMTKP